MSSLLREFLGVSQAKMAEFLGLSRSYYSMYELHLRDLPLKQHSILSSLLAAAAVSANSKGAPAEVGQEFRKKGKQIDQVLLKDELQKYELKLAKLQHRLEGEKRPPHELGFVLDHYEAMSASTTPLARGFLELIKIDLEDGQKKEGLKKLRDGLNLHVYKSAIEWLQNEKSRLMPAPEL